MVGVTARRAARLDTTIGPVNANTNSKPSTSVLAGSVGVVASMLG